MFPAPVPMSQERIDASIAEPKPLGPLWMAAGIILLNLAGSVLGTWRRMQPAAFDGASRLPHAYTYISQMWGICMLLGVTVATIFHRREFFRTTLERNRRPWGVELGRGLAIFIGFLLCVITVRALFHAGLRHATLHLQGVSDGLDAIDRHLHVGRSVVEKLVPATPVEALLWVGVSFSAAFCEEHIFRGYLLPQAITWLRGLTIARTAAIRLGVLLTAMLFASLHAYEGIAGVLSIALLGVVYGAAAIRFGNLRAVIAAHFLQDLVAGLAGYAVHGRTH